MPMAAKLPNLFLTVDASETPLSKQSQGEQQHGCRTNETELLSRHAENEIGPLLRDEIQLCLRAVQVSLAEEPARSDGHLGLQDVVSGAQRIGVGIEERGNTFLLVRFQAVVDELHGNADKDGRREHNGGDDPMLMGQVKEHAQDADGDQEERGAEQRGNCGNDRGDDRKAA